MSARRIPRGSSSPRLDPVRWRRPSRGLLLRLAAVVALLVTAAAVSRSRPPSCAPAASSRSSPTPPAAAASPRKPTSAVPAGSVGVPVRLADPTALAMVHPGNRVDLLRLDDPGAGTTVASDALVLSVTGADDPATGALLLALPPEEARQASAPGAHGYAILIRPG